MAWRRFTGPSLKTAGRKSRPVVHFGDSSLQQSLVARLVDFPGEGLRPRDAFPFEAGDGTAEGATYDLSRFTVLLGMIDTHVHIGAHFGKDGRASTPGETPAEEALYGAENAYAMLMAGFTTVQSIAPDQLSEWSASKGTRHPQARRRR
jgi:hypothetical protein